MVDVMWARPDGERVLLVDTPAAGAFIGAIYRFDRVEEVALTATLGEGSLHLRAGEVELDLHAAGGWRLPLARVRPPWVTRWIEGPVARRAMGVRTYGVSPTGVREWYRADEYRPLRAAMGRANGLDLGGLSPFPSPARFGFSEPPRRPAMVKVRPLLEDPSGRLDAVVASVHPPAKRGG
ncbi:MAG: hypothetical protein KY454_05185 [Actinobacteria bacterium]|nr:hypothetical protein [Actinomycetota bacterium]